METIPTELGETDSGGNRVRGLAVAQRRNLLPGGLKIPWRLPLPGLHDDIKFN